MRALLGEQPSLLDTVGPVALNQAVGCDSYAAVLLLLDRGVRELYDGRTGRPREEQDEPITHAFYEGMGQVEAAEVLIVLGADTRRETRTGKTALQSARLDCKFLKD